MSREIAKKESMQIIQRDIQYSNLKYWVWKGSLVGGAGRDVLMQLCKDIRVLHL